MKLQEILNEKIQRRTYDISMLEAIDFIRINCSEIVSRYKKIIKEFIEEFLILTDCVDFQMKKLNIFYLVIHRQELENLETLIIIIL